MQITNSYHKQSASSQGPGFEYANTTNQFLAFLSQNNFLTKEDIAHIQAITDETEEPFDLVICKLGLMTEKSLSETFSTYFHLPLLSAMHEQTGSVKDAIVLGGLNEHWLQLNRILPLYEDGCELIAAIVNPSDRQSVRGLSFAFKKPVSPVIVTQSQWETLFAKAERQVNAETIETGLTDSHNITADVERLKDMASAEPVVRLVNRLLVEASDACASDIHIEPGARGAIVRFRVDGELLDHETLSVSQAITATSRIKILSSLDIAERRRPQDGRFSFPVAGHTIDLRISTIPTDHGESLVIRLLDQSRVQLDFDALGFFPDSIETITHCLKQPHGILLVTGPTGSGKTTTLYTFLKQLATGDRKILTIEDPIEYRLDGINQSQANPAIGVTFASALRSFLRHDPDVMMVGEIRDLETAKIAVQAALTGHLVLSTLHTNDAPSAITRLRDIGVEDYLIASTLIGVLGQRLVRRICDRCGTSQLDVPYDEKTASCPNCNNTGFKGRLALVEALAIDEPMKNHIRDGDDLSLILQKNTEHQFVTMADDGKRKIATGLTTIEQVEKAVGTSNSNTGNRVTRSGGCS